MSIKDLFSKKGASFENAATGSLKVESRDLIISRNKKNKQFVPNLDFSSASNFAKFGSAKLYYDYSIRRIYNDYPYDGSRNEKLQFDLSSSYLDRWILDNKYPKSTGYINFSYGGWGTAASITDGYGIPNASSDYEYIFVRGGLHTASSGMQGKPLWKTFNKSVVYDSEKNRTTTFILKPDNGHTVEFWLKKEEFDVTKTKKEVILDLWNGETSSSAGYGRFTLELSGAGPAHSGQGVFRITLQSGSKGVFDATIGTAAVTTGSLSTWHHYAFSFVSGANCIESRLYIDGDLNEKKNLGSDGIGEIGGLINGYIGALQTSPSSSNGATTAAQFAGKLSASLDEFRFWKDRRTSEEIYNNWHRHVGGGTNTDDANVNLGLYYKFNEGVVGDSSFDSVVMDYSGRIANGTWTGYTVGSRNTGSAFVSSSLSISEDLDPIMRSIHPDVIAIKSELEKSGSQWDDQNPTMLYNKTVPDWIKEEDMATAGTNVRFLYQIISSYFDTLYSQITSISKLKNNVYPINDGKPIPFADKLLENKGLIVNDILINSSLLEKVEDIDANKSHFEKNVFDVKNLIYTNLYNNLTSILKSKGSEKSIRNALRCFGIDDELLKLNVYTDGGTHYLRDKRRHTSLMKKYITFNNSESFESTVFQTSSVGNSYTFLTGSETKEVNSAFTAEISVIFPEKSNTFEESHFFTPFVSSSIFGMHEADSGQNVSSTNHYSWDATDVANFQVYATRDKRDSKRAKFVLKTNDNSTILTSSYFPEVYSNQTWNIAVRVKPQKYPFLGNVAGDADPTYMLEFYGVHHSYGTVNSEFLLTASLDNDSGSAFLCKSKRFYVGAHRTNFTGSVLEKSDVKVGSFRFYLDYLSDNAIRQHNLDPSSYGTDKTYQSPTMFATEMENTRIASSDLIAINWDFETVTSSDSSGEFVVDDISSGSSDSKYGWIDNIARVENRGYGFSFPASSTGVLRNEIIFSSKKQLPEISHNSDKVKIENEEDKFLIKDDDVSDNFYSIEKSMSQVISDEMLKMFSSIVEFNNLIGKAVDRYRIEYKNLNLLRDIFYSKVEEDPDFDKFTEYYKWIDSSISSIVSQLFPISARNSGQIFDIVESHILERNKYQNKFPIVKNFTATEAPIKGSSEIRYNWKFGHAPVSGDDNENQTWQKLRKERIDITDRETIRKAIITEKDVNNLEVTLTKPDLTIYQKSTFALRRLSKPYRISQDLHPPIHGGINYPPKKDRDVIYHLTQRHGAKGNYLQPLNTVVAGAGTGNGINAQQKRDTTDPNSKTRVHLDVFAGRYSNDSYVPSAKDEDSSYAFRITELQLPITIMSQSVVGGYSDKIIHRFDSGSIITNIHSDTTTPTNHIPMQGPFTETWVGGHQHRHVPINKFDTSLRDDDTGGSTLNNLDNKYTRPEGWRIKLGDYINNDGAVGIVGPDYGGPYPDPARKVAVFYREERAKRPVNFKNIRYTTGSKTLGNFKENYELISAAGKSQNNLYLRKNPEQSNYLPTSIRTKLPETTHPMSLLGQLPNSNGNVFGTHVNNRQPDKSSLTYQEEVAGQLASGSIKLYGVERIKSGDILYLTSSSDSVVKRFIIGNASDSDPAFYITGSTNVDLWHDFRSTFESNFSYTTNSSSVDQVTGSAIFNTSSANTSYLTASVTDFSASAFTFAGWFYLDTSVNAKAYFFETSSSCGQGIHASAFVDTYGGSNNGQIRLQLWYTQAHNCGGTKNWVQWQFDDFRTPHGNKWNHIAFTHQSSSTDPDAQDLPVFYLNAVSQSWTSHAHTHANGIPSDLAFSASINPINAIHLFSSINTGTGAWKGGMDEVMWYNTVLNEEDIESLYNCGISSDISNPSSLPSSSYCKSWWTMGDHSSDETPVHGGFTNLETGDFIYDVQGNNNLYVNQASITGRRMYWGQGMPRSSSYAIFNITASSTGAGFNQTLSVAESSCSWGINSQLAGGVTEAAGLNSYVVAPVITSSVTNTIILTRFSAPGGIETSRAYLDVYSREYSVYNSLNYRNLTVRGSGSGESTTIRMETHVSDESLTIYGKREQRRGLRSLLSAHCGKFGRDSEYGGISTLDYNVYPSYHKVHRNVGRRPTDTSTIEVPVFNEDHNNAHFSSLLPRSDFQYSWITSSLGYNYGILSGTDPYTGRQRIYGYAPTDGIVSSSVAIGGESGFVAAINFPTASEIFGV
jgi:hypothetical protein